MSQVNGIPPDRGISHLSPDLQAAFQKAVQAENRPLQTIDEKKGKLQQKVDALNDLLGKVEGVRKTLPTMGNPVAFRELTVNSDDAKVISGIADKNVASPGKHSLEVVQLAQSASALSNGIPDKDETRLGTGYLKFNLASGESKEVFIDYDNSTLEGISKVINSAGTGIHASVVNDQSDPDAPFKLLLSGHEVGTENMIEYPELYLVGGEEDFFIENDKPAANAIYKYQGYQLESPTNELKDVINGVTVNLKGLTDPGKPATLSVEQDIPKTTLKVKDLVDNINHVFSFIQNQTKYEEDKQGQKVLNGDYGIRMAEDRLRNVLQTNYVGQEGKPFQTLADLGIEFTKTGTLTFNDKKLEHALSVNYEAVSEFLTGDGGTTGLIPRIRTALDSISGYGGGLLSNQKNNLTGQITKLDTEYKNKERMVKQKTDALKDRLSKMQGAISQLQNQTGAIQSSMGSGDALTNSLLG